MPTKATKIVRNVLFWVHLTIGLSAGALILLMSATGAVLGFERQLIAWFDGTPTVNVGAQRQDVDRLLVARGINANDVSSVLLRAELDAPVTLRLRERGSAPQLIDPYSGDSVARITDGRAAAFFSSIRGWHRWVGMAAGDTRQMARKFTGAANLAFAFLAISGLWLWWPRRWTRASVLSTVTPRLGLRGRTRDFNWHNAMGFWMAIPLFLLAATGAFISYQWPERWLDRVAGSAAEQQAARAPRRQEPPREQASASTHAIGELTFGAAVASAKATAPDWRSITLSRATTLDTMFRIVIAEGNTYRPDLRQTLVADARSGEILEVIPYAALSLSRRIRAWVRFGHTGEVFGWSGQLLATLACVVGVVLVVTGFLLTLRRFRTWSNKRWSRASEVVEAPAFRAVSTYQEEELVRMAE